MKKLFFTLLIAGVVSGAVRAADLIVDITGVGGAYSTITSAIAASTAGDRLLIYPNGTPFSENITVPHSLQLLSAVEGERWQLNGGITIAASLGAGGEVIIASLHQVSGSIASGGNIAGGIADVRVVGSKLLGGNITFNHNNYRLTALSDSLMNGYIMIRKGNVSGNYITPTSQNASCIYTYPDPAIDDEYLYIVGNHLAGTTYSYFNQSPNPINWNCSSSLAYIANNYITSPTTYQNAIYIATSRTSTTAENFIINNTINITGSNNSWPIYLITINSNTHVFNNVITGASLYGIASNTANNLNITCSYNYISASVSAFSGIIDDGTNVINVPQTIDAATGEVTAGSGIDGGHPDAAYTDLDLTRNDAGCFGGSYSRTNFLAASTGSRTGFMIAPRRVLVGETINVEGQGFDY